MAFSDEEIQEFQVEASELIDSAEQSLLALDQGESFSAHYDAIFRVFHSLKGAAGMMELAKLQSHMHNLEHILSQMKGSAELASAEIEFFLRGADAGRRLLRGEEVEFSYDLKSPPPKEEPRAAPAAPASPSPNSSRTSRGRLIVIDDEPELLKTLESVLTDADFDAFCFTDPREALRQMDALAPDSVLTDLKMPGLDGMEVLRQIQARTPDVPVLFISGYVDKTTALQAIDLGVYSIIEKPFRVGQVIDAARNACQKHRTETLFRRTLRLIMYQFADLDQFLNQSGKHDVRKTIRAEIEALLATHRELNRLSTRGASLSPAPSENKSA